MNSISVSFVSHFSFTYSTRSYEVTIHSQERTYYFVDGDPKGPKTQVISHFSFTFSPIHFSFSKRSLSKALLRNSWKVLFVGKNDLFPLPQYNLHSISNIECVLPTNLASNVGAAAGGEKNLVEVWDTREDMQKMGRMNSKVPILKKFDDIFRPSPCKRLKRNVDSTNPLIYQNPDQTRPLTLAQGGAEEHPPTGRTISEALGEEGTCRITVDNFAETSVLANCIRETNAIGGSVVEKDPGSAAGGVTICQKCGDRGFSQALIYCDKCQVYAQHRYCLEVLPETFDEYVIWFCNDCEPKIAKPKVCVNSKGVQGAQSEKKNYVKRKKNKKNKERKDITCSMAKTERQRCESSSTHQLCEAHCSENCDVRETTVGTHCQEVLHTVSEENLGKEGISSPDRLSSQIICTSVLNMASNFDETFSADNSCAKVGPYHVKSNLAPILQAIMDKYGDIAQDCFHGGNYIFSIILEGVCTTVKELKNVQFSRLQRDHLKILESAVTGAESVNMKVEWLRHRYDELKGIVHLLKPYKSIKEQLAESSEVVKSTEITLDSKKANLMKLEPECQSMETQLESLAAQLKNLDSTLTNVKSNYKRFCNRTLADGLL